MKTDKNTRNAKKCTTMKTLQNMLAATGDGDSTFLFFVVAFFILVIDLRREACVDCNPIS
jgi:hypothetical protein